MTQMHSTPGQTLSIDPTRRVVRAVISTSAPDRSGDIVVPAGLRNVDEFLRNPVVLWAHQRQMPPIGTCERLTVEPDRVIAETRFSEASSFARDLFALFAEGVLRGWSIGFVPHRARPLPKGGTCFTEWELLEYSAVPVPDNPQALTVAMVKGLVSDDRLKHWLMADVLASLVS